MDLPGQVVWVSSRCSTPPNGSGRAHEPAAVTGELNHERAKLVSERHAATVGQLPILRDC